MALASTTTTTTSENDNDSSGGTRAVWADQAHPLALLRYQTLTEKDLTEWRAGFLQPWARTPDMARCVAWRDVFELCMTHATFMVQNYPFS